MILLFISIICNHIYGQGGYSSIQEIIETHVKETKNNLSTYDNIYIMLEFNDTLSFPDNVWMIKPSINPKFLKKNQRNFLIRFIVTSKNDIVQIDAVNFGLYKISNKHIKLLNLGNGSSYRIASK